MDTLRMLNVDDLLVLRHLLAGRSVTATAAEMGLSQPAITQRLRKIDRVFGTPLLQKAGRRVRLTEAGIAIGEKAKAALSLLDAPGVGQPQRAVHVGTRPEVGMSWVWPTLVRMRQDHPQRVVHCHFGSGEEILRRLAAGHLDAVVTSAPHADRGFRSTDLAREDYVCVAAPSVARRIKEIDDLRHQVLIEHDRSFPFLRYVPAAERSAMKFQDVWFVGSTNTMVAAALEGFGVAIVSRYLARTALKAGTLRRILAHVPLEADYFRLVYRVDGEPHAALADLAATLKRTGLR